VLDLDVVAGHVDDEVGEEDALLAKGTYLELVEGVGTGMTPAAALGVRFAHDVIAGDAPLDVRPVVAVGTEPGCRFHRVVESIRHCVGRGSQFVEAVRVAFEGAADAVSEISEHESEITDLREETDDLESTTEELRSERSELEARTENLSEKQRRLEALDGVEADYTAAETRYEDNKSAESELESIRERIGEFETEVAELDEEIASYGDLDSELDTVKETQEETKEGYETYIAHEEEASKRDEREEAVEEARSELADLRSRAEGVREEIGELESEFDEERFEALDTDIGAFEAEKNQLTGKRETVEGNLSDARSELDDLYEKQSEKEALEAEIAEIERDKRFAGWSRNTLQQGAADLRDLITTEIGHRANEVFQQLRGNPTETLVWDKTYNLRVRVKGQDKPFDSLSGGEKMAAALAVRLAILERLASVGMAFLDEPTANLDTEKKQNLVNQLESLEGLGQLTVVSHDRTFEAMTERAVVLEKDETDEVTRVVSQ